MKSLKLALLVTTAAGAVAAGGVTYATVGNSSPAAPSAQPAKDSVAKHAPATVPGAPGAPGVPAVPTCLPNAAKGKVLSKIKELAKKAPNAPVTLPATPGGLPQVPNIDDVTGKVPGAADAQNKVSGVTGKVSDVKGRVLKAKDAANLPLCQAKNQEKSGSVNPPNVPGKTGLPVPAGVSCDSVPPVIKNEEARAKDLTLPNGMHVGASHAHSVVIQSRAACIYTQEFVNGAKQMITLDRITTPPHVSLRELAASLKMAGSFVSVSGVDTWTTPSNNGMLWYSKNGYAVRLTGTGPAATLLPAIATQLQTQ